MPTIGSRDLVMLVIGLGAGDQLDDALGGITRLQKYLYLLESEGGVRAQGDGFAFEPYKKGPYSAKLYDDLEFLENLGLLESRVTGTMTEDEADEVVEVGSLTIDDLFDDPAAVKPGKHDDITADAFEERQFSLTERGIEHVKRILDSADNRPVADAVRKVKSRFASHSLTDLLHYVYTRHPDMTTASDIKQKVLRRGRSG